MAEQPSDQSDPTPVRPPTGDDAPHRRRRKPSDLNRDTSASDTNASPPRRASTDDGQKRQGEDGLADDSGTSGEQSGPILDPMRG